MNIYVPGNTRDRMRNYNLVWSQIATEAFEHAMNAYDRIAMSSCVVVCGNKSYGPFPNFFVARKAAEKLLSSSHEWSIVPINKMDDQDE